MEDILPAVVRPLTTKNLRLVKVLNYAIRNLFAFGTFLKSKEVKSQSSLPSKLLIGASFLSSSAQLM